MLIYSQNPSIRLQQYESQVVADQLFRMDDDQSFNAMNRWILVAYYMRNYPGDTHAWIGGFINDFPEHEASVYVQSLNRPYDKQTFMMMLEHQSLTNVEIAMMGW
jgi:hypothetical protein